MEASTRVTQTTVIEPAQTAKVPSPRELWQHRDLIYFLVRRDIAVRYKQSAIGVAWAILQPLLLGIVFSVFLGALADIPSKSGVPYPVFALTGMVLWLYFANAMSAASASTVASAALISKVYFPRIIIPIAAVLQPTVDFGIALVVAFAAMAVYGVEPGVQILLLPLLIPLALGVALGLGLWFSALNVKYRDFGVLVPNVVMVGLFITPIMYPFSLVPEELQPFYALNPMVGVLEAFRWSVLGPSGPG